MLGAAAVCLLLAAGGWIWLHRVDLFEIPAAWRLVKSRLPDRGAAEESDPEPGFDEACQRLLDLQHAGLSGGNGFHLIRLSRGTRASFLGWADGEGGTHAFVLDGGGRILDRTLPFQIHWDESSIDLPARGAAVRIRCLDPLFVWEYSIDERGLVPHGFVTADDLAAPVTLETGKRGLEQGRLILLLASGSSGDSLRALDLINSAGHSEAERAAPLLSHPDPLVRARAASVCWRLPGSSKDLVSLLDDPSPQVRLSAALALERKPAEELFLEKRARDPDPRVARWAHFQIALRAPTQDAALRSLLWLVQRKDPLVFRGLWEGRSSPAIVEALLEWLEESLDPALAAELNHLETPHLAGHSERLVAIVRRFQGKRLPRAELAAALARIDDRLAQKTIIELLAGAAAAKNEDLESIAAARAVLIELFERGAVPRGPGGREALDAIAGRAADAPFCELVLLARALLDVSQAEAPSSSARAAPTPPGAGAAGPPPPPQ